MPRTTRHTGAESPPRGQQPVRSEASSLCRSAESQGTPMMPPRGAPTAREPSGAECSPLHRDARDYGATASAILASRHHRECATQ